MTCSSRPSLHLRITRYSERRLRVLVHHRTRWSCPRIKLHRQIISPTNPLSVAVTVSGSFSSLSSLPRRAIKDLLRSHSHCLQREEERAKNKQLKFFTFREREDQKALRARDESNGLLFPTGRTRKITNVCVCVCMLRVCLV
jgi:hypothetical protein